MEFWARLVMLSVHDWSVLTFCDIVFEKSWALTLPFVAVAAACAEASTPPNGLLNPALAVIAAWKADFSSAENLCESIALSAASCTFEARLP